MIKRGFTLLELLVAMAIFATAGMAIMQASSAHIRSLSQLDELTMAGYIANNQMQLALLDTEWPGNEKRQGELEMANRSWLWQQQLIKVPDNDLRLVQIRVSLAEAPEQVLFQLQSYKGKPGA
ncbi:type II secretion system minor pseudopilin GspI [Rheinheimera sp. FR7-31]|uniref:type II secretion system minor pseudopilin GspI n=1 Tax=Rheinheimera fenheensis TaxID=3152295 RepID=UPI00325E9DDE